MQRLFHLFNEEDNVVFRCQMDFCSSHGGIARQVAAHEDTLCMAASVIGVSRNPVLRQRTKEHFTDNGGCRFLTAGYLERHRPVNTHHTRIGNGIKQHGDVAMTYQPFGMLLIALYRYTVQQVNGTISASRTDDSLNRVVLQSP